MHVLKSHWCVWTHLVHDADWTLPSYTKVHTCYSVEELIATHETVILSEPVIRKCMLFFMKGDIFPSWEDESNVNGGCFSFKLSLTNIRENWATVLYSITGNTVSDNPEFLSDIAGVVLSPKKHYYIVQIWMKTRSHSSTLLSPIIQRLAKDEIIFKKYDV